MHQVRDQPLRNSKERGNRFEDFFLRMDMFPKRLHLYLPSGKDKYQTGSGGCLSLLLVLILVAYIVYDVNQEAGHEHLL